MTSMSIHDVARIEIDQPSHLGDDQTLSTKRRKIIITDKNGNVFDLTLFADDMQALKVHAEY